MGKTVLLTQQEGVRFSAKCGDNEIVIDWKEEDGGTNRGMSPGELFCASLGACTVMNVVRYYKTVGIPLEGVKAEATYEGDEKNSRATRFEIRISLPVGMPKRERAVRKVADLCYVKKTLRNPPEVTVKIEGPGFD
ncbi:MAG: OsmC family protein [Deltaproteobacteria bacterium]|nr:OsmC family protein [Deltaproteobacteria bacterium]MBW2122270.1 OsmC family protein [Deltaproteobacteria bacterium]